MKRDHKKYRVFMAGFEEFERIPLPQPGVFIAHDFSGRDNKTDRIADAPRKVDDYRLSYADGFIRDDGTTELVPVYAPVHSGTILQTLCKEMINTDAGIFDVSFGRRYNANVLIELGISLGINHPTIVVAEEAHKPLLDFLEILNPLYYKNENDLAERIGDAVRQRIYDFDSRLSRYYCTICQQKECRCRKSYPQEENRYWLAGADGDEKVYDDIRRDMKHVARTFNIKPLDVSDDHHTTLCNWLYHIRKSRFALFYSQSNGKHHHGAENAKTMVQLGMAIGAGIPWRLMLPEVDEAPTDLKGYVDIRILDDHNLTRSNLMGAIGALRDINMPYLGVEDILPMGEWVEEEEEPSIDMPFSGIPMSPMINVPPNNLILNHTPLLNETEIRKAKERLLSNPTAPILLDSIDDINKQTLAIAVCYEPDVREYFDLGICWIDGSLSEGELASNISSLPYELDNEPITKISSTLNDEIQSLLGYLEGRFQKSPSSRILFVIDNAQDPQIAQALSALVTPQSVVLFTTRDSDILASQEADASQSPDDGYWFISYAHQDGSGFTERLVEDLVKAGIRIWHDRREIKAGMEWQNAIENALRNATGMILVMTERALQSQQVMAEANYMSQSVKPIIPISISPISTLNIPYWLGIDRLQWIDMSNDYQASLPRLITAIRQQTSEEPKPSISEAPIINSDRGRIDELLNGVMVSLQNNQLELAIEMLVLAIEESQDITQKTQLNVELEWLKQQTGGIIDNDEVDILLNQLRSLYTNKGADIVRDILQQGGLPPNVIDKIITKM